MEKINIIFDFDGVVGNSMPVLVRIGNEHFGQYFAEPITLELVRAKGIRCLIDEYHVRGLKLLFLVWKARRILANVRVGIIPGMEPLLQSLHDRGFLLQIVSTGGSTYIQNSLIAAGCFELFARVYSDIGVFNKAKYIRRASRVSDSTSIYIGDEVRDIEAAHKVGIKCISVAWGYESRTILQKANPDYLVDTPEELLNTINTLALNRA